MPDETNSSTITNGFHLVVDALKLNGFDTVYGLAGIPVTDLARLAQASGIRYIGFRHEASAGNAWDYRIILPYKKEEARTRPHLAWP
jgi:oxalyl-CoA decarboxylase